MSREIKQTGSPSRFSGKTVLVTGAAVRIGESIARAFAAEGARVVIHYRSSACEAEALRESITRQGGEAWTLKADLTTESACDGLIRSALDCAGALDVLVNSAAVFNKQSFADGGMQEIMAEFWPNLFAPWHLMRTYASVCSCGRIVNLLDRRIQSNDPSCVPYLISKKAFAALTSVAALSLAPRFTVNAVAPGPVLPPPGYDPSYLVERAGRIPMTAPCSPESVASAVLYLAAQDGMTGNVIYVDGGQHLLGNGV